MDGRENERQSIITPLLTFLRLLKWKSHIWLPSYYMQPKQVYRSPPEDLAIHVMVLFVDHFEPAKKEKEAGVQKVKTWCDKYLAIAEHHQDSDGVWPQHTWFYRYDYPNFECIRILSEYTFKGFGEIEFHLHHGYDTPESFSKTLHDGVTWFNQAGAMLSAEKKPSKRFGYIAGNWALDNGRRDPSMSGVNTELELLSQAGCYADFTFPAFGENSQPRKVNSIHYAKSTPKPKSYSSGVDVEVGKSASGDLMIFQGPLYVDWFSGCIEYAAFESYTPYFPERIDYWIKAGVHVKGRPNWIFVKIHTHGMQSRDVFLSDQLDRMFTDMETRFKNKPYYLHYVTAREAYNIVKAAEAGETGDPNTFRDYAIATPSNKKIYCNSPYTLLEYSQNRIRLELSAPKENVEVWFKELPLKKIKGKYLTKIDLLYSENTVEIVDVQCDGTPEVIY